MAVSFNGRMKELFLEWVQCKMISDHFGIPKGKIIDDNPQNTSLAPDHIAYSVVSSVEVPVLGKVHAGVPLEHDEVVDTTRIPEFVYAQDPDVFMIHSEGDV